MFKQLFSNQKQPVFERRNWKSEEEEEEVQNQEITSQRSAHHFEEFIREQPQQYMQMHQFQEGFLKFDGCSVSAREQW